MFATLDRRLFTEFTFRAFHTQHNLFGRLCLKKRKKEWIKRCTQLNSTKNHLPSFWKWASFDHQNLVVCDRNDDVPGQTCAPWTSCTVSPCATCDTCTFCRKCVVVSAHSPKYGRVDIINFCGPSSITSTKTIVRRQFSEKISSKSSKSMEIRWPKSNTQ